MKFYDLCIFLIFSQTFCSKMEQKKFTSPKKISVRKDVND